MNCDWVKSNVLLYVYDELADDARYELEKHVERCPGCAAELQDLRGFKAAMTAAPQAEPSPNLLAASRMRLQEALEEAEPARGWRRLFFDPMAWLRQMKFSPALAAVLVIVGFAGGVGTTFQIVRGGRNVNVPGVTTPSQSQPAEAAIAGIRDIVQQPGNKVDIKYDTLVPHTAQGSLDDPRIQQLLLFAARNNQNSGVRMDSVEVLTQKPDDEHIRQMLVYALRYDNNPGVRLKALEALGPYVKGDMMVRNAVLDALANDSNPGVRTQAIQMIGPVKADGAVQQVLAHLASQDKNGYIRNQARMLLASAPQMN